MNVLKKFISTLESKKECDFKLYMLTEKYTEQIGETDRNIEEENAGNCNWDLV